MPPQRTKLNLIKPLDPDAVELYHEYILSNIQTRRFAGQPTYVLQQIVRKIHGGEICKLKVI
jgi:hypothetical protein